MYLHAPHSVLMIVVLASKLSSATVENVKCVRQLRCPRRLECTLSHPLRQWHQPPLSIVMPTLTWDACAIEKPLTMQCLTVLKKVLDVFALHIV